jgi:hypothetical protein
MGMRLREEIPQESTRRRFGEGGSSAVWPPADFGSGPADGTTAHAIAAIWCPGGERPKMAVNGEGELLLLLVLLLDDDGKSADGGGEVMTISHADSNSFFDPGSSSDPEESTGADQTMYSEPAQNCTEDAAPYSRNRYGASRGTWPRDLAQTPK